MKVHVQGKLLFRFPLTGEELVTMMFLSMRHYDSHCKSISQPGGFLRGWQNYQQFMEDEGKAEEFVTVASWREIDTLLKVLETRSYLTSLEAKKIADSLTYRFSSMLDEGRELVERWTHEFEVDQQGAITT